jgi:WD40 repeat protein
LLFFIQRLCELLIYDYSRDTTVKVWDIVTLTEVRSLGSHTGSVTDVLIIPGKLAVKLGTYLKCSKYMYCKMLMLYFLCAHI